MSVLSGEAQLSARLESLKAGGGYTLKMRPLENSGAQNHMILLRVTDADGHPRQPLFLNVRVD